MGGSWLALVAYLAWALLRLVRVGQAEPGAQRLALAGVVLVVLVGAACSHATSRLLAATSWSRRTSRSSPPSRHPREQRPGHERPGADTGLQPNPEAAPPDAADGESVVTAGADWLTLGRAMQHAEGARAAGDVSGEVVALNRALAQLAPLAVETPGAPARVPAGAAGSTGEQEPVAGEAAPAFAAPIAEVAVRLATLAVALGDLDLAAHAVSEGRRLVGVDHRLSRLAAILQAIPVSPAGAGADALKAGRAPPG